MFVVPVSFLSTAALSCVFLPGDRLGSVPSNFRVKILNTSHLDLDAASNTPCSWKEKYGKRASTHLWIIQLISTVKFCILAYSRTSGFLKATVMTSSAKGVRISCPGPSTLRKFLQVGSYLIISHHISPHSTNLAPRTGRRPPCRKRCNSAEL